MNKGSLFKIWHEAYDIGIEIEYDSSSDMMNNRGNFYYQGSLVKSTPNEVTVPKRMTVIGMDAVDAHIGLVYKPDEMKIFVGSYTTDPLN